MAFSSDSGTAPRKPAYELGRVVRDARTAAKRPKAAAAYLGIGESSLWTRAKSDPDFPRPIKLGARTTVFMTDELDAYLAKKRVAK